MFRQLPLKIKNILAYFVHCNISYTYAYSSSKRAIIKQNNYLLVPRGGKKKLFISFLESVSSLVAHCFKLYSLKRCATRVGITWVGTTSGYLRKTKKFLQSVYVNKKVLLVDPEQYQKLICVLNP